MSSKIAKKIIAIMQEVTYLQKDGKNNFQKYDYVSEAGAVKAVRQAMINNGVIAYPDMTEYRETINVGSKGDQILTSVSIRYTFVDADSGESISFTVGGQGMDKGDKGIYQAFTGANKYALMKLLQIPTGDDPEDNDSAYKNGQKSTTVLPDLLVEIEQLVKSKDVTDSDFLAKLMDWMDGKKHTVTHARALIKKLKTFKDKG